MESTKKRLLILVDWYEPGFRAGGPIRSVVNVVERLKDRYDTFVVTGDRDLGNDHVYEGVLIDGWNQRDGYSVFYASAQVRGLQSLFALVNSIKPDIVYLNSMYSVVFSLYPLLFRRFGMLKAKIVLAPRGMLKNSAMTRRRAKKTIFLRVFRLLRLHKIVTFQATDEQEASDIQVWFGNVVNIARVPNLPGSAGSFESPPEKKKGFLKIVFVGRIHPIKNLDLLLRALMTQLAVIELTVVAPVEDAAYWKSCQSAIASLPNNVSVRHFDHIPHRGIESIIKNNHIFALPTAGENFGHAIFEALCAGRPVLISNQTPWRALEGVKAGWDVNISSPVEFSEKIKVIAEFGKDDLEEWCLGARRYCVSYLETRNFDELYFKLFS